MSRMTRSAGNSIRPPLSDELDEKDGHCHARHIRGRGPEVQVALSRDAFVHGYLDLGDTRAFLAHEIRKGIGFGAKVGTKGELLDHATVIGTHARRRVLDDLTRRNPDHCFDEVVAEHAHALGLWFVDKTRANDDIVIGQGGDHVRDVFRAMLTVGIELNGTVVVMVVSVLEARLERAGEAQIDGQIEKAEPMFTYRGS